MKVIRCSKFFYIDRVGFFLTLAAKLMTRFCHTSAIQFRFLLRSKNKEETNNKKPISLIEGII